MFGFFIFLIKLASSGNSLGKTHFKVLKSFLTSLVSFPVFTVRTLHHYKNHMIMLSVGLRSNIGHIYC